MTAASRVLAVLAPCLCAAAVGLGSYASHGPLDAQARERIGLAALFAFGHGVALLALATRESRLALVARCGLAAGVLLFSGSLLAAALTGPDARAMLAPAGGLTLIAGWLLLAWDGARPAARRG